MSENASTNQGQRAVTSWMGVVAPISAQREQVELGYQWKYKVRIIGKHTGASVIPPERLDYAIVMLPTTAGSGAGHRIRSVRIAQGDTVYGIDDGFNKYIIGVFPRTTAIDYGVPNEFGSTLSGFTSGLQNKGPKGFIEPTEQTNNPVQSGTAFSTPPKSTTQRTSGRNRLKEMGIETNNIEPLSNTVIDPPRTPADKPWTPNTAITSQQLEYIIANNESLAHAAYDQAVLQGIKSETQRNSDLHGITREVDEDVINYGSPYDATVQDLIDLAEENQDSAPTD